MKNNKAELEYHFTNFRGAVYHLLLTVNEEMKRRKGTERSIIERDVRNDLSNVPLALSRIAGEFDNFCNEYITDVESRKEAANQLIAVVENTRQKLTNEDYEDKERRLSYLESIEAIIYKVFAEVLQQRPVLKLRLNAPKNVVYNLFQQLKAETIQGTTPFLSQSYDELAEFLIQYVEGFEKDTVKQVSKELSRKTAVKKKHFRVSTFG